jgi:hypothetical protein
MEDLETFWADRSEATGPPVTPDLILAGREKVAEQVHLWLRDPAARRVLQGESREETLAVFAAELHLLPEDERLAYLSRTVVAPNLPTRNRLTATDQPRALIPAFDNQNRVSPAMRQGHHALLMLGPADSPTASTVSIPRLSRDGAEKALVASNVPENRARERATLARRSLTSFRRKIAVSRETQQPEWTRPGNACALLSAMLASTSERMAGRYSRRSKGTAVRV